VGKMIEKLRDEYKITNKSLLIQCGIILGIVIFLFIIHGILHLAGYDHEGPRGIARARIMSAVQQAVFFEIRGYRLDFRL